MTSTDPVAEYLGRLDLALRDVPFGTAREIRAGVAEELGTLEPAAARARIAELGDPAIIAAEASDAGALAAPAAPPTGYGGGPGSVAVTALLVGIGGLVLPVVGWIAGLVALWTGRVWTTLERWIATLAPPIASAIVVGIWWAVQSAASAQPSPDGDGFQAPDLPPSPSLGLVGAWWMLWLGSTLGYVVIGIWLAVVGMRRVRT